MQELYLINATLTEANAVKLEFIADNGEQHQVVDENFKSYFYSANPLTSEEQGTVKYFSGKTETVEKTDLFTNQKKTVTKITWPNPKIALKAAEKFHETYENEIDPVKAYVYDKGLIFGMPHHEKDLSPVIDASLQNEFERIFQETAKQDPLKYAQSAYWFGLLSQTVPNLNLPFFGEDAKQENIHSAWLLSRIANVPIDDAFSSRHVSDWIKSIIYLYLKKSNILVPSAEALCKGKPVHQVPGALTVSPTSGIYFNTVVCDFESLYPSCIDSFNLSYETVDCSHEECRKNRVSEVNYHVCTKQRGFYAVLVGALKDLRIKVFKPKAKDTSLPSQEREMAQATAKLLKLLTVSSYGVTVRIHGLACPPLAEAITGYGRYVLKESWKLSQENGLKPLYGDTDSLFLDQALQSQVELLIKTVKARFGLDLAVDKQYSLCVLSNAKKAYFGIFADGTPDIKGLTAIKSNSPQYVNGVFHQCVKILASVKNQSEYEQAKQAIKEVYWKALDELRSRKVGLEELTYSVRLYFDPNEKTEDAKILSQPYQCAKQLIDAGKRLNKGDTVVFVKVKPFKYQAKTFTVKPLQLVKNTLEINLEDYLRNLSTALNQTFKPMGIKLENKSEKETGLSKWMV